ncbi:ankyrin repeat and EF-hand domain-containing protein 1 [Centroberyx gerrardi]
MSEAVGRLAEDRLEILQVQRLLQCVTNRDQPQVKKLLRLGVSGLVNLTERSEGRSALQLAASNNHTDMVSLLLAQGAEPAVQDRRGRTAVMLAAELGHEAAVALLADSRAAMSVLDNDGKGVLFYCVSPSEPHMRCLELLLNSNADVNNVSGAGTPVLLSACRIAQRRVGLALRLLERGANPNAVQKVTGRTALMEACMTGEAELVRAILQRGGNPNSLDEKKMNAAHMAAEGGFFELIVLLSAYGADLAATALNCTNALHLAAAGGFAECCRFLAQRGCNAKQKNSEGLLPRQMTEDKGTSKELKKAERLQAKLSGPGAAEPETWRAALHDWSYEHQEALRIAMETQEEEGPVDIVTKDTFVTVMKDHHAPMDDDQLQKILQEHDRSRDGLINISDFFRGVHYLQKAFTIPSYAPKQKKAVKGGKGKKKGKFVLPMPVCVLPPALSRRRPDGGPPLFMIKRHQPFTNATHFDSDWPPRHPVEDDSVWYLDEPEKVFVSISQCVKTTDLQSLSQAFSCGVPVDVQDQFYKTPLMISCSSSNLKVAEFLISCGADVNLCDQFNWTPLHHACSAGQLDIIKLLVDCGAEVDAMSMNGATPLMKAIESCRPCCVDYLITVGAKVQTENKNGQTCMAIARSYGDKTITELVQEQFDSLPKPKEQKGKKG